MSLEWAQAEAWMRPKVLDTLPEMQKEWVAPRAMNGRVDASHIYLFCIFKVFAPGNADEKCSRLSSSLNPQRVHESGCRTE